MKTTIKTKLRIATMADFICQDAAGNDIICKNKDYWIVCPQGTLQQTNTSLHNSHCLLLKQTTHQEAYVLKQPSHENN